MDSNQIRKNLMGSNISFLESELGSGLICVQFVTEQGAVTVEIHVGEYVAISCAIARVKSELGRVAIVPILDRLNSSFPGMKFFVEQDRVRISIELYSFVTDARFDLPKLLLTVAETAIGTGPMILERLRESQQLTALESSFIGKDAKCRCNEIPGRLWVRDDDEGEGIEFF